MKTIRTLIVILITIFFIPVSGMSAKKYETPGNRKVSDILQDNMIKGKNYRVRDKVVSYGYMNHFTVESDFGVFEVTGIGALRKLLKEIRAIAVLQRIEESEAFKESVKKAAQKPVQFGKNMITDPVDTVSGVPKGVFRLFGNAYTSVRSRRDPSEDSRTEAMLSVSAYKREYAYKFGVDVYSSNSVLQKELNKVGWAGALGSLSLSAALAPVGGLGYVVKYSRLAEQFSEMLRDQPPPRLRQINEEKLSRMGVSSSLARAFLDHQSFTPRHDTVIAGSLEMLKGASGRDKFIQFALSADDEESANFFQNIAEIIRGYHEKVSPIKEIKVVSGLILARAKNGSFLIPFPLDHGVWTERADRILNNIVTSYNKSSGKKNKYELWVAGTVSQIAQKELKKLGIKITKNVDKKIEFMY